ncbi:head maturation protease, ClpP-related [Sutcliffiella horikoshii]|uniref:head maturation protease, ClpP-related n=1 Tax=Sutcliffiella horikoshii TaxID=79883 RepID=UPI003CF726E1
MKNLKGKKQPLMTVKNLTDQSADLYIYGEIVDNTDWKWDESDVMPDDVLEALQKVDGLGTLNIYINSPGGSVFAGLAIYNMLKRNKAYKKAYIDGIGASMASVIPFAADEIFIPSNAFLMIHNPWTGAVGNAKDLRKIADDLDVIATGAMNVYMENVKEGVTEETIQQMLDEEKWLNGIQAAEYFNVTVIEEKKYAACASEYLTKYNKTPKSLMQSSGKKEATTLSEEEKIKFQNELDLLSI